MGPKLTQAEGFILSVGAKLFPCYGARCAPSQQVWQVIHWITSYRYRFQNHLSNRYYLKDEAA